VQFDSPILSIYLVKDVLETIGGNRETVSVLAIGDGASGVTLEAFSIHFIMLK